MGNMPKKPLPPTVYMPGITATASMGKRQGTPGK